MLDGGSNNGFKPREERRSVALRARLLGDRGWSDACILNLSSRGMLLHSATSVEPGSYVEVRRGEQVIVARVMWRRNQRVGLNSQQRLSVEQIIAGSSTAALHGAAPARKVDRRKLPRDEQSRIRGRMAEFASVAFVAAALASFGYTTVADTLATPLAKVTAALRSG